ncbi:MAG: rod shape-determining protein MreC [Elusimicrobiaceae bacterium]|nr:rod shape-determining protein MreC [Elusimicrobiaceae bacterium]
MSLRKKRPSKKPLPAIGKRSVWFPVLLLTISFLLMILPLEGFVLSVKAVLSYVFIPQVRAAHSAVKYAGGVHQTVQELLRAHQENYTLKQQIEMNNLLAAQAETVFRENERLAALLQVEPVHPWTGVWARVAYREPSQWNTVIIDKGSADGIEERSAVLSLEDGQEGLAGVVIEVTENTSKVLLVRDEDFSAAVMLERGQEEGLLVGGGVHPVRVKYIPLLTQVEKGDKVFTSATSSIFPAGILVGQVRAVREDSSFQTAQTIEVEPQVRSAAVKELFVISRRGRK